VCTLTQTCMHEWQLFPVNLPTLPPLERVARGNDAMTQAPAPARASSGPNCLARHKVGPGVPPTLAVARVSKRRLLYVHERSQGVLRDFPIRRAGRPAYAGPSNTPRVVDAQALSGALRRGAGARACASTTLGVAKGYQPPVRDKQCANCQESRGLWSIAPAPHDIMPKREGCGWPCEACKMRPGDRHPYAIAGTDQ